MKKEGEKCGNSLLELSCKEKMRKRRNKDYKFKRLFSSLLSLALVVGIVGASTTDVKAESSSYGDLTITGTESIYEISGLENDQYKVSYDVNFVISDTLKNTFKSLKSNVYLWNMAKGGTYTFTLTLDSRLTSNASNWTFSSSLFSSDSTITVNNNVLTVTCSLLDSSAVDLDSEKTVELTGTAYLNKSDFVSGGTLTTTGNISLNVSSISATINASSSTKMIGQSTVTFNNYDGTIGSVTVNEDKTDDDVSYYGSLIAENVPSITSDSSTCFVGWSHDGTVYSASDLLSYKVTDDCTFTAKYNNAHTYDNGVVTKDATCTEEGEMTYTCTVCGYSYTDEIEKIAHTYGGEGGTPTFTWTGSDDGYTATATFTCTSCKTATKEIEAEVTSTTSDSSCTTSGSTTYTATVAYNNSTYTDIKSVDNGTSDHNWGEEIEYTWSDDRTLCTAKRTCLTDSSHVQTAITTEISSKVTAATCTEEGSITYTATFSEDWAASDTATKTDAISATGHTVGDAVTENEVAATCTTDGSYESVVYCTVCKAKISSETVTVPATGHVWEVSYKWSDDLSECTATRTCTKCGSSETATAKVTSEVTKEATYLTSGVTTYTATFSEGWAEEQKTTQKIDSLLETIGTIDTGSAVIDEGADKKNVVYEISDKKQDADGNYYYIVDYTVTYTMPDSFRDLINLFLGTEKYHTFLQNYGTYNFVIHLDDRLTPDTESWTFESTLYNDMDGKNNPDSFSVNESTGEVTVICTIPDDATALEGNISMTLHATAILSAEDFKAGDSLVSTGYIDVFIGYDRDTPQEFTLFETKIVANEFKTPMVAEHIVDFVTNCDTEVDSQTVVDGGVATEPDKLTKDGYTFEGWYIDSDFTTEYDFSTLVTEDKTLYAKWEVVSVTTEESTAEPEEKTTSVTENPVKKDETEEKEATTSPKTSDDTNISIYALMMILTFVIFIFLRKKEEY